LYLVFITAISWFCVRHPIPDDFDRYMYEALVRSRHQSVEVVYSLVKHESPRAEESSILDSPDHMAKLEPLYAIRPAYLWLIAFVSDAGLPIQRAINLISAVSLWSIGVLILVWTGQALPSALLLASAPILVLGRIGSPDPLSAFFVLLGLWAVRKGHAFGLVPLLVSVWVRTDNVIVVFVTLIWLAYGGRISWRMAVAFSALAAASVLLINHLAHNYGWAVLFHWSFLSGYRSPADIPPHVTSLEYLSVFLQSLEHLLSYVSLWLLLALAAWWRLPSCRPLLSVVGLSVAIHFVLYPSAEDRYLIWAFVAAGVAFIDSIQPRHPLPQYAGCDVPAPSSRGQVV
jgi:hypothetical protein